MSTKRKRNFWRVVKRVVREADVLLLLLDARFVKETRNLELEEKIRRARKPLIYVVTKTDLSDGKSLERWKKILRPLVLVSVKKRKGRKMLKKTIEMEAERFYGKMEKIKVGVLGYPNVGKSSLINYMKGKHSVKTSIISGFTKSLQLIRLDKRIYLIDTPGVIPYKEKDEFKHVLTNVKDFTKVKDPDLVAINLMRRFPGVVEAYYGVSMKENKDETLREIAIKRGMLTKGGEPDIARTAVAILKDYQTGKINLKRKKNFNKEF